MANRIRFELNRAGVAELLNGSEMASICAGHARTMTVASGVSYVYAAGTRVVGAANVQNRGKNKARRQRTK